MSVTRKRLIASVVFTLPLLVGGCADKREALTQPRTLWAPPYGETDSLWAVAPLNNESGTTLFDPLQITDQLVGQIERVEGVRAIPLNRTLGAMQSLKLSRVSSPQDARALAEALGVDAVLVGTITGYDPYNPPKFGLTLALFARPGALEPGRKSPSDDERFQASLADPVTLQTAPVEVGLPRAEWLDRPLSVSSAQLDGADQGVQAAAKEYAIGRSETVSALGWRRYLASMRLFTDFACFHMTERLLEAEARRVGPAVAAQSEKGAAKAAASDEVR